jgi:hypothetical protein
MKSIARPLVIGTLIIFCVTFLEGCGSSPWARGGTGQDSAGGISTTMPLGGEK